MIVERIVWKVKMGCTDQVVEILKSAREKSGKVSGWRLYTPNIGKFDVVSWEYEYENLTQYEKEWQEFWDDPETAAFMEKWNSLVEAGGEREIWNLV